MQIENMTSAELHEDARNNYVKYTVKATVFSDLFCDVKNLIKLYRSLHPEDTETVESDLKDITIRNVLINDIMNDLGFRVGNRLIILLEAQSTWSLNIVLRVLLYLARTYQLYVKENEFDIYSEKKFMIPKPELYVVYLGDDKNITDEISLSDEFFNGDRRFLDLHVKVIRQGEGNDILNQYISFSKVYNEQRRKYGRTKKAIIETIRICRSSDILKEYLASREKEVVDIMMTLFDEEEIREMHEENIRAEGRAEGESEGILKTLSSLVKDGILTIKDAAERMGVSESEFTKLMKG